MDFGNSAPSRGDQLSERGCSPAGRQSENRIELGEQHQSAHSAGEPGDHGLRHVRDQTPEPQDAEPHHNDGCGDTHFRRAADSLLLHRQLDKRNSSAAGASDQQRIPAQDHGRRRRKDGCEDPQNRRQSHQGRHCQTVGQRDQSRDHAAKAVPREQRPRIPCPLEKCPEFQAVYPVRPSPSGKPS